MERVERFRVVFVLTIMLGLNFVPAPGYAETRPGAGKVCLQAAAINRAFFYSDVSHLTELADSEEVADAFWSDYLTAFAHYRLASLSGGDRGKVRDHANEAIDILEALIKSDVGGDNRDRRMAEASALLSGAYGMKIAANFLAAIRLGPKSSTVIDKALAAEPNNPRVLILDGIRLFHTPERFGGDQERARDRFISALSHFDAETTPPCWGVADAHYWLARYHGRHRDNTAMNRHINALDRLYPGSPVVGNLRRARMNE